MSIEKAAEIGKQVSAIFIDTDSVANKTNASTGAGLVCMSIAAKLALVPEPHAQVAAAMLGVVGFLISLIHRTPHPTIESTNEIKNEVQ